MKRKIIQIDEEKCTGCGDCATGCPEGAIQIIEGKARLVSDFQCDGLGACVGQCPEDAISIIEREAVAYDEVAVIKIIIPQGSAVIQAHLQHLHEHEQHDYLKQAIDYLNQHNIAIPELKKASACHGGGHAHGAQAGSCPGSKSMSFEKEPRSKNASSSASDKIASELSQWPIQLHLINPVAPYFSGVDLVIAADCTAFSYGDFHRDFLQGKKLVIACPKLDDGMTVYQEKIQNLIEHGSVKSLQVIIMEVPCCGGLYRVAQEALNKSSKKVPLTLTVIGLKGNIVAQELC